MPKEKTNEFNAMLKRIERNVRAKVRNVMSWSEDVEYHKKCDKTPITGPETIVLSLVEKEITDLINQFDNTKI